MVYSTPLVVQIRGSCALGAEPGREPSQASPILVPVSWFPPHILVYVFSLDRKW